MPSVPSARHLRSYYAEVARGNIPGESIVNKFGSNPDCDTGAWEDIWYGGGTYTGWITSAKQIRVASGGNVNDTAAGTGARKVLVSGLDQNWLPYEEELTLAGASASSASTGRFLRVFRAYVTEVGSYGGVNAGQISIETTDSEQMCPIATGVSQSQLGLYTIPANRFGLLHDVVFSAETAAAKTCSFRAMFRINADSLDPYRPFRLYGQLDSVSESFIFAPDLPGILPPKTDFVMQALADSNDTPVSTFFNIHLVTA